MLDNKLELSNLNVLVSVIIPVYNVEKYLDRCVESVVNQTYKNIEIILVNDGSPDACPKKCDEWGSRDKRIVVVHKQNGGLSSARNAGIDICKGKYICFVDSDDFVKDTYVEKMLKKAVETDADIVMTNIATIDDSGDVRVVQEMSLDKFAYERHPKYFIQDNPQVKAYVVRNLYKADLVKENKFDEGVKLMEDMCFSIKILTKTKNIQYINDWYYYYYINNNSISRLINNTFVERYSYGILTCCKYLELDEKFDLSNALKFNIYLIAINASIILGDKTIIRQYSEYNTSKNYKCYKNYHKSIKSKIKSFLGRHRLRRIYSIIYKIFK